MATEKIINNLKLVKRFPKNIVTKVKFNKMKRLDWKCINDIDISYDKKKTLRVVPIGDCCSISYIIQFTKYPFKNLKGKIIKGISEINDEKLLTKNFKYIRLLKSINNPNWDVVKCYIYKIEIENGKDMYFGLVNNSNGFYDGWIEVYKQIE
jgi:hypothetical protein